MGLLITKYGYEKPYFGVTFAAILYIGYSHCEQTGCMIRKGKAGSYYLSQHQK
jgi:hypothetical protein